ncbi:MAG: hypothetical protein FWF81_04740, partial [Defluviitaleaceae bacterium]|nr:hypothetical protein [Defluviitaleaceae bacterium]
GNKVTILRRIFADAVIGQKDKQDCNFISLRSLSTPEYMPYSLSCITIGEAITLTVTSCAESNAVINGIFAKI